MDSPYSPLQTANPSSQHGSPPPLVPIPPTSSSRTQRGHSQSQEPPSYDPNYHRHPSHHYSNDPYYPPPPSTRDYYRDPYGHVHNHGQYPPEDYRSAYAPPPTSHYDPYYRGGGGGGGGGDPYAYPPPRDPYGRGGNDYYGNYPPRDPYYAHHSHPRSHSRGPYHHHEQPPYSSGPPPPLAPHNIPPSSSNSVPPLLEPPCPSSSTAVSLGPHPFYGHLDPLSDINVPILYLARPISTKTFLPLKKRFDSEGPPHSTTFGDQSRAAGGNLELKFVDSLLNLEKELKLIKAQDLAKQQEELGSENKNKSRRRRRVFITAVGGTDSLVQRIWQETLEPIEWKEIVDLGHLQLELMFEEKRVDELNKEADDQAQTQELEEGEEEKEEESVARARARARGGEGKDLDRTNPKESAADADQGERTREQQRRRRQEWEEQERGRREIEEMELQGRSQPAISSKEVEELDRVLRAVRGEKDDDDEPAAEPGRLGGTSRNGERGQVVVDRFEDMVKTEHPARSEYYYETSKDLEDTHSRKRSRHESDEGHDHSLARAARKKLEAICKAPRRNCVQWASENDVPVNEETKLVDQEPVLGERHRGVWDLFGHELDEVSPQIQVLMARAMRDVTYPPRLRLYSTPEANEQLEQAVPWFSTLLKTIGDRYELAGSGSIIPQDPPVSDNPLDAQANQAKTSHDDSEERPLSSMDTTTTVSR